MYIKKGEYGLLKNDFILIPTITIHWELFNEIAIVWGFWEFGVFWWKRYYEQDSI